MDKQLYKDTKNMTKEYRTKLIFERDYSDEVNAEIFNNEDGWSPYLLFEYEQKLYKFREALRWKGNSKCIPPCPSIHS